MEPAASATPSLRERTRFYLIDCTTLAGKLIDIGLIALNILACILYVVMTYAGESDSAVVGALLVLEWIIIGVFIVEYCLRMWVVEDRRAHALSFYSLVDLVSILPAFSTIVDLRFLRVARIFRVFRFFRYLKDERFFFGVVTITHLRVARLVLAAMAIIFVSSGCIYETEMAFASADEREINSLGDAAYYTVVTVTTVGLGDITTKSEPGRLVTVLMIIAGVVTIPYHLGQIAQQIFRDNSRRKALCPKCGLAEHDADSLHCRICGEKLPDAQDIDD